MRALHVDVAREMDGHLEDDVLDQWYVRLDQRIDLGGRHRVADRLVVFDVCQCRCCVRCAQVAYPFVHGFP